MNLIIKQSTNQRESVNNELVEELYKLTKPDPTTGHALVENAVLVGRIEAPVAYEDAVEFLNTQFSSTQNNGSDLRVSTDDLYIRFADAQVESILVNGIGDKTGVTISTAESANISSVFDSCSDILSFNEFKYFTSQQMRSTCFRNCYNLESIDVSNCSVVSSSMFQNCGKLKYFHGEGSQEGSLTLSDDVTSIGSHAFENCTSLTSINIPVGLTSIGGAAFSGCTNMVLADLNLPNLDTLNEYAFCGTKLKQVSNLGKITKINFNAFSLCTELESVILPDTVLAMYGNAFCQCTSLASINIPNEVVSIGSTAFSGCTSLASIDIPSGVTGIGSGAFRGCSNLVISHLYLPNLYSLGTHAFFNTKLEQVSDLGYITSIQGNTFQNCAFLSAVTIPSGVTSIGYRAFGGCTSLASIDIPSGVTDIGGAAFSNCTSLSAITIPSGVTSIGAGTFSGCTSLASIDIPSGVTSIEERAFYNCASLASIDIPSGVTSIEGRAFDSCTSLSAVTIPSGVTSIEERAFCNCASLSNITIPSGVTSIGYRAFSGCMRLISVTVLSTTPPSLANTVFADNATGRKIYVPYESVNTYKTATEWRDYAKYIEAIPS